MPLISFHIFSPPASLSNDVECLRWARHRSGKAAVVKVCPNGTPGLVFQEGEGPRAIQSISTRTRTSVELPRLFLHKAGFEPSVMRFREGEYSILQVALRPQALFSVFGWEATLVQGVRPAGDFGAEELVNRLSEPWDDHQKVEFVWEFLERTRATRGRRDELVERCLHTIHAQRGVLTVARLLEGVPLSERQLERRFTSVVGCTPKKYLRIKRVNEALRLLNSNAFERLSDIAYELEYFDQSHFIRDLKEFTWLTPRGLSQRVEEFRQDVTGFSYQESVFSNS